MSLRKKVRQKRATTTTSKAKMHPQNSTVGDRYAPLRGAISCVRPLASPPAFAKTIHSRGAKRDGLHYQQHVSRYLTGLLGDAFLQDVWLEYQIAGTRHLASPDGLWIDLPRGRITIVETKRTHTSSAFRQLRNKYLPILQTALKPPGAGSPPAKAPGLKNSRGDDVLCGMSSPLWTFFLVEVAPIFDPLDTGGETVRITKNLLDLLPAEKGVNFFPFKRPKRWN
jgi:hypothetical protein